MISLLLAKQLFASEKHTNTKPEESGLYTYSGRDIAELLKNIGYKDFWTGASWKTLRNSDGTELRFIDEKQGKILVLSCDGSIQKIDMPGAPTWLNDEHEAVAWHVGGKGLVYYRNGKTEKISGAFGPETGPDPSGNYFVKSPPLPTRNTPLRESCKTAIYSIENPDLPMANVSSCGAVRIFFNNGKLFLFGKDYDEKENKISDSISVHIFQVTENKLLEIEKKSIEVISPHMHTVDFSPWANKVLLMDDFDPPSRPVWYEFNLETNELKKVGKVPFSGGRGFYLQCDIIKEVSKKLMKSK